MDQQRNGDNRFYLSRRLIVVVGLFILAASGLVVLTNFSINMIAASGDYSAFLSKWNQHHYRAGMYVERFARSGDQVEYAAYQKTKASRDTLKRTIDELFREDPEVKVIFENFERDAVSPNEISGLITAFQYFRSTPKVKQMHRQWEQLEDIEGKQNALVEQLYQEWNTSTPSDSTIQATLQQYNKLNKQWNTHNDSLMAAVGDASGVVKQFALWISVILGILLVLIGVVFTVRANKSISRWEDALYEKEVLLTEIHHRVKNNMAVISGMLELESMQDTNSDRVLQESRDRIKSMAIIHEILYQSNSFSEINLGAYLHELTEYICSTYLAPEQDIRLDKNFEDVKLNINQAVPVGLIINEIMANAIEHGFGPAATGTIMVSLHEEDEEVTLQIKDDGEGLPDDISITSSDNTGASIINALVQQINAGLTVNSEGGLNVTLVFTRTDASGSSNALF